MARSQARGRPGTEVLGFLDASDQFWDTTGERFVVVDGEESSARYEDVGKESLMFSPNRQRIVYDGLRGNRHFLVVDGAEGPAYDGVACLTFSPDSEHVAFVGWHSR